MRLLFGLKNLAWQSVIQPVIMPKPDLIPLTGGYRRIPVMQIGADVFCDSQVILAEIERRAPEPKALLGPSFAINLWADRLFFQTTIPVLFGQMQEGQLDQAFIDDRTKLSGQPFNMQAHEGGLRIDARAVASAGSLARAGARHQRRRLPVR